MLLRILLFFDCRLIWLKTLSEVAAEIEKQGGLLLCTVKTEVLSPVSHMFPSACPGMILECRDEVTLDHR